MKPEELTRVANEIDGEEYDLNAVVDYVLDRRAAKAGGGHQSERLYTSVCAAGAMLPYPFCWINLRQPQGRLGAIRFSLTRIPAAALSRSKKRGWY